LLLLLLLLTLPAVVEAQFTYTINNGTVTITGYTGPGGAVVIPSTINGLPVTTIGNFAFYGASLTSVTFGTNVTSIGIAAFYDGYNLTNVTISHSVTAIGSQAFQDCNRLTNVTIPSSVYSIGDAAFAGCTSLTAITVDALNYMYSSVAGVLFNKSQTTLIQCPAGIAGAYTIPNSVSSIGNFAFEYCTSLTCVTIHNSVRSIGYNAFQSCTSLTSVTIPNGVTNIRDDAFQGCTSLTSVTIPSSVTSIGYGAFFECWSLTSVTLPNSVTAIGSQAFFSCTSLGSVTIGNSVTNIGDYAFAGTSLTSVTIPNSVTYIGDYAFNVGTSLTTVTLPDSVTSIGDSAFAYCTSLTGIYFKGNAPSLGGTNVFSYATNVTVYYLPGTTGWGATYGGLPTALWIQVPTIQTPPQTQTAEANSTVGLRVGASSPLPLFYLWYFISTNLLSSSTNRELDLTNLQMSQSGAYTVVISNVLGAVTSAPAMLQVIAAVERRPVPGVKLTGGAASLLNVDYADSLSPAPYWTLLGSISLTGTSGYCCDPTLPLPPQRFYRAWQAGTPGVMPSLDLLPVPAITLTGTIGHSVRLDYINQFGPIDAWITLATVPLTNTSQLYFDVSAPGQPQRLYRLVPSP
jgi:hypothetical protein